jgi:Fe-S-cluster containining protein
MTQEIVDMSDIACKKCGDCCKNKTGIAMMIFDVDRISHRVGLPPREFIRKYCDKDTWEIKMKNGVCPFYTELNGCTIHDVKPLTCKSYPYNMVTNCTVPMLKSACNIEGEKRCFVLDLSDNASIQFDAHSNTVLRAHHMATQFYHERIGRKWHDKEAKEFLKKANELLNTPEEYNRLRKEVAMGFTATQEVVKTHNIKDAKELLEFVRSQGFDP